MDYIKNRVASTSQDQKLDSIFKAYVHFKYGNDKAINILDKIAPLTKKYFQSSSLSEVCARSSYGGDNSALQNNKFVSEALHVCMDEIRNRMSNVSDNEVFDNKLLLTDLHSIIEETYTRFANNCNSKSDAEALEVTFGVLYGSIEYWSNSENSYFWSSINSTNMDQLTTAPKTRGAKQDNTKKEEKKLSKSEWIQTVGAADAAGALAGSWFGPQAAAAAGLAASAAAAATNEVE